MVLAPHVPACPAVIPVVLDALALRSADAFVDFGCGDGRFLLAAACRARLAVGVELDPCLALRARAAAASFGRRVRVLHEPVGWTAPLGMTAGFCNLLPASAPALCAWLDRVAPAGFRLALPAHALSLLPPRPAPVVLGSGGGRLGRIVVRFFG